eukprot:1976915-Pleurochrysis_carterae.AAC.1
MTLCARTSCGPTTMWTTTTEPSTSIASRLTSKRTTLPTLNVVNTAPRSNVPSPKPIETC